MSDKTDEPREGLDLFSIAGLPEHAPMGGGDLRSTPPAVNPYREIQKRARSRTSAEENPNERYLPDMAVAQRYSVSRQTVWRWAAQKKLPEPIRLSPSVTRWRLSDLIVHEGAQPRGAKGNVVSRRSVKTNKAAEPL
jgi:prophage regulatory protein